MRKKVKYLECTRLLRIGAAVLGAALFLIPCSPARAQMNTSLGGGDFSFIHPKSEHEFTYLYPDIIYYHNPAVIADVERPLLFANLHGRVEENFYSNKNANEFGGSIEEVRRTRDIHPSVNFFTPINETWKTGGFLYYSNFKEIMEIKRENIDLDENGSIEGYEAENEEENLFGREDYFIGNLYLARSSSPVDYGLNLQYEYRYTPVDELFGTISGPDVPGGPIYTDDPGTPQTGHTTHKPALTLGGRFRRGPIDFGLSLQGKVELDSPRNLFTQDEDGDGISDQLVSTEEFYGWESYSERGVHPRVYLRPSLIYEVGPRLSIIGSGDVALIDYDKYTIEYDGAYTLEKVRHKSMRNYLGLAGVEIRPQRTMALRLGGGYEHFGQKVEVADNGIFLVAPGNDENYYEVDWGYTPGNNEVIHAVNSHYWEPDEEEHIFFAVVGLEWDLSWRMRVFFSSYFSRRREIRTYRVYDRVDGTVWVEVQEEGSHHWVNKSLAGAAFDISDNLLLSVATDWTDYEKYWEEDGLPVEATDNTESPDTTENNSFWQASVHIRFVVGF